MRGRGLSESNEMQCFEIYIPLIFRQEYNKFCNKPIEGVLTSES